MADYRLLFYLLSSSMLLVLGIYVAGVVSRNPTKYNLTMLAVVVVLFISGVWRYFHPGPLIPGAGVAVDVALEATLFLSLVLFLFYPDIMSLRTRRRIMRLLASVEAEKDPDRKNEIYRDWLKQTSQGPELLYSYANFLWTVRNDYDKAEQCFLRAIEQGPKHAGIISVYARFVTEVRQDYDRAEALYKKALEQDPQDAFSLGDYAHFLWSVRKDYDRADEYFTRAINADPKYQRK